MRHPWATRRERIGLTQELVAFELNVNRQTVIRLEQSLFHQPSEEVLTKLGEIYAAPIGELIEEYNTFVKTKRGEFAGRYPNFHQLNNYTGFEHPLVAYRESIDLTRLGFCRALCLDYGPISDYENNKQRGIPLELIRACSDMMWDYAPLEEQVVLWRQSGRADKVSSNSN